MIFAAAFADTRAVYEKYWAMVSSSVKAYIDAAYIKPEKFIKVVALEKGVQINEENTANRVETEMIRLITIQVRHQVILRALIRFALKQRDLQARARIVIEDCRKANQLLIPFAHASFKEQMEIVLNPDVKYDVNFDGGAQEVLVKYQGKDDHQHTVNLITGDCSCGMKMREGKGCRHAMTAYRDAGLKLKGSDGRRVAALSEEDRLRLMYHEQYFVDKYAAAFMGPPIIMPNLRTLPVTDTIEPAIVPKKIKGAHFYSCFTYEIAISTVHSLGSNMKSIKFASVLLYVGGSIKTTRYPSIGEVGTKKRKAQTESDKKKKRKRRHSSVVHASTAGDEKLRLSFLTRSLQKSVDILKSLCDMHKRCVDVSQDAHLLLQEVDENIQSVPLLAEGIRRAAELKALVEVALEKTRSFESAASASTDATKAVTEALQHMHSNASSLIDYRTGVDDTSVEIVVDVADVDASSGTGIDVNDDGEEEEDDNDDDEEDGGDDDDDEDDDADDEEDEEVYSDFAGSAFGIDLANCEIEEEEDDEDEVNANEFSDVLGLAKRIKFMASSTAKILPRYVFPDSSASASSSSVGVAPFLLTGRSGLPGNASSSSSSLSSSSFTGNAPFHLSGHSGLLGNASSSSSSLSSSSFTGVAPFLLSASSYIDVDNIAQSSSSSSFTAPASGAALRLPVILPLKVTKKRGVSDFHSTLAQTEDAKKRKTTNTDRSPSMNVLLESD